MLKAWKVSYGLGFDFVQNGSRRMAVLYGFGSVDQGKRT
jgi:hypothetical protein